MPFGDEQLRLVAPLGAAAVLVGHGYALCGEFPGRLDRVVIARGVSPSGEELGVDFGAASRALAAGRPQAALGVSVS